MSIGFKAKDFLFEVNRVFYSLVSYFLKLGIWLWAECACFCTWNISLLQLTCFSSWALQLITQGLNMLVVSLCKAVIHKLSILAGGKLDCYKSMGGTTKKGLRWWGEANFEIWVGESKKGRTILDSNLVRGKSWGKLWFYSYFNLKNTKKIKIPLWFWRFENQFKNNMHD